MRKFCVLPLALIVLAGCGGPTIVGKWNTSGPKSTEGTTLVTEFQDKTFTVNVNIEKGEQKLKFDFSGDYTFDGKKLKMTAKTVHVDDSTLPAMLKSQVPMIKSGLEKQVLNTQEGDAKLDGDTLTFTVGSQTTTFTRIK